MPLSKSQYIKALQCHKALWLAKHRPELVPPADKARQHLYDSGHEVGELARGLFPGGVEIECERGDFEAMIANTAAAIAAGATVIYEAAFRAHGVFVMADILVRDGARWNLYEVKASTRVKPYHEHDAAIQWFVIGNHLPLGRAHIVHVDTGYELRGALEIDRLLAIADISDRVRDLQGGIADRLESIAAMLDAAEPDIPIGPQCNDPYACDLKDYCWRQVPRPSVFDLYRLGADKKFALYREGRVTYADLADVELNAVQTLQVRSGLGGEPRIEPDRIREFLAGAEFPINFLDFETLSSAVPKYDGQRPYAALPFQYSLHRLHADGEIEHREFLADERADPRPGLVAQLVRDVTPGGSIVAFNKSFEQRVIRQLAAGFAEHAEILRRMNDRFIDLLDPFRQLMYYHPDFNGSFSIKSVLPAMFPGDPTLDYEALDIHAGDMAMLAYQSLAAIEDPAERRRVRDSLRDYCRLDTWAMVAIWRKLAMLCQAAP